MAGAAYVAAMVLVLYPTAGEGTLRLSLVGYNNIPTDGSGRILISDIGGENSDSLICISSNAESTSSANWYYDPTSPSIEEAYRIQSDDIERGWWRNRDENIAGERKTRLRRMTTVTDSVEGAFLCNIVGDSVGPITVGIYYAISSVDVSIDVVSMDQKTLMVTCMSTYGTVLDSSLTGPGGLDLELEPVGTLQYRGQDVYGVTTATRMANDGDTYYCTASNGVSTQSDSLTLGVAGDLTMVSSEQVFPGTTIRVTWSASSGTVTGYQVHYSGGGDVGSVSRDIFATYADILNLMNDGRTYTISVEAQSVHFSGESTAIDIVLLAPPSAPTGVNVSHVQPHSVLVSWSAVPNVDRYTVNYVQQTGAAQLGLCISSHSGSIESTGTSVTVEGAGGGGTFTLRAFTTYSVIVRAVSERRGNSSPSDPILFTTAQTAADASPTEVQANAESSTAITVSWNRIMSCKDVNGLIVRFEVMYQALPSGEMETAMVFGVWNMPGQIMLTGLTPFTNYSIRVAAVNNQSDVGEFSEPVITRTNEDTPGSLNISTFRTFFKIAITWEKPERPNGVIIAYEVAYHPTADPQTITRVNTTDLATSLIVRNLPPGTELNFTVRAYTRVGAGKTSTVTEVTYITAPPVESVVAIAVNATAVRITWRTLQLELSYYTVLYSATGGGGTERSATSPTNDMSVLVRELAPGEEYMFQVVAVAEINGSIVEGERSAVATATTSGGILVQLRLHGILNCRDWAERNTTEKMKDISSSLLQLVQDFCLCGFSTRNIDSEVFRCFDGAEDSVTYRVRLLATAEVDTQSLSSYLEEWVAAGSSVVVGGAVLSVDEECSVEIADLLQEEEGCKAQSPNSGVVSVAVMVAIVAVPVVAAVAVLITIIIIILKRRSHRVKEDITTATNPAYGDLRSEVKSSESEEMYTYVSPKPNPTYRKSAAQEHQINDYKPCEITSLQPQEPVYEHIYEN